MVKKKNALSNKKADFLAKVRKSKATFSSPKSETLIKAISTENPRLLFSMDATASRDPAWDIARELTGAMFEAIPGELDVALAYHSGSRLQEVTPFTSKVSGFQRKIQQVQCHAGLTCLNEVLDHAVNVTRLKALIYIGDCFEEEEEYAYFLAGQLKLKGVRVFIFHDTSSEYGYDTTSAGKVFQEIAKRTGGAVFPFDVNSPEVVKALLEAISIYAGRGIKALRASKLDSAQRLLAAMDE